MASEIRVDKINSLSGVGTVTLSPTGVDIAGITTAATLRATTGIVTSLTAGSLTSLGAVSGTTGTFSGAVSGTTGTFTSHVSLGDSDELRLGDATGGDLKIYHDGNNSAINDVGTGSLYIQGSNNVYIRDYDTSENHIVMTKNGAVELYYDGSKRIETHTQGAAIASGGMTMPTMNSFSSQILVGASGFIGNYHDGTTNQQLIVGTNQYYDSGYKSRTNTTAAQLQFYERTFRFNTAAAPGSAGGALTQVQALRIDTDGIKFGTDTAAANALDDYEIGTWTPVFKGSGGDPTQSYATQNGTYVKIGSFVHCEFDLKMASSGVSGGSGYLQVGGVPFPKENSLQTYGISASFGFNANLSTSHPIAAYMAATNQFIYLMSNTASNGNSYSNAAHVTNSSRVLGGFTFRTHY